ncbi:zinc-binding dehydrogenase [Mongoliibacter ruber]|uniref:NADPH:quinone reductase-like Zn-dependent oxidoreductase n=1 Tax=Mongoliibacter ruber TaxID=1750599 RepID=A0A2T0WVC6_9BACT|nr:zinc-binding dehydrogenase [Mongoliibacter ruber]PRY90651.1 NADPH:quinone reductase-like Zn-dependent oxidoreductase [Mongoliibacter ruber]
MELVIFNFIHPNILKALVLDRELPDAIKISDVSLPDLNVDQVLIQIKSAALNHRDEWCRQGLYPNLKDGVILGSDGAGIVKEVGGQVDSKWIGQEVIINPAMHWGENQRAQGSDFRILGMPDNGTIAQYLVVASDRLHHKPLHMNWHEAAALPLAGVTAYRALIVQGKAKASKKILVTGFGGGVAQMAVQFALSLGAEVYTSSSSDSKLEEAKKLGVSGVYNYNHENWVKDALKETGGFDLIIDSAMGDTLDNLINASAPGARIVFYGATQGNPKGFNTRKVFWNQIKLIGSTMGSDTDFLNMLKFVDENRLKPIVDEVFSLENSVAAFNKMKSGNQLGKLVIQVS